MFFYSVSSHSFINYLPPCLHASDQGWTVRCDATDSQPEVLVTRSILYNKMFCIFSWKILICHRIGSKVSELISTAEVFHVLEALNDQ